jgi:SAM-dependent methyltransferase
MAATSSSVPIDPTNVEQLRAWDGDEGAYWADHADYFDRAVGLYHERLLDAAEITPTDRVLDVGCGTGQTTRDAARRATAGEALGVDLSSRMLEYAHARAVAEGIHNASFQQADAQVYAFQPSAFDVAISRTGAMFFGDLGAAFANIARAIKPGGRLALTTWRPMADNEWIRAVLAALSAGRELPAPPPGAPGPFSLSEPDRVRAILTVAGFDGVELDPMSTGMWFGEDADDAYRFVLGLMAWMLKGLDDSARTRAAENLRATMAEHATSDGVFLDSAAWIIRATRT